MKRKKPSPKKSRNASMKISSAPAANDAGNGTHKEALGHVIERPDGFYVQAPSGEESGPFPTLAEAEGELLAAEVAGPDLEASDLQEADLQEAESEIGVSEWIDPETGGPAEDSVPRIEDH
jgi:hypothetical protein